MADMLVRLYALPGLDRALADVRVHGVTVRRALLLAVLHAQREKGYAYAIIGDIGPAEFYARTVGAVAIEGSTPGIHAGVLADRMS
jgi:hypothetical protein